MSGDVEILEGDAVVQVLIRVRDVVCDDGL